MQIALLSFVQPVKKISDNGFKSVKFMW